ncbi:MAG: hypothetical protein ACRDSR_17025 [Pseudonocardiaceae bacterium]
MRRRLDDDELIEHWTLVGQELDQVAEKRGPTRLTFALLPRFHTLHGRFPRPFEHRRIPALVEITSAARITAAYLKSNR